VSISGLGPRLGGLRDNAALWLHRVYPKCAMLAHFILRVHHWAVFSKIIHSQESRILRVLLRRLRKQAGLTQGQLAEQLGVQRQIVTSIERGERMFLLLEVREFLRPLGVGPVEFMEMLETELTKEVGAAKGRND